MKLEKQYEWDLDDLADFLENQIEFNTKLEGWREPTVRFNFNLEKIFVEELIDQLRKACKTKKEE